MMCCSNCFVRPYVLSFDTAEDVHAVEVPREHWMYSDACWHADFILEFQNCCMLLAWAMRTEWRPIAVHQQHSTAFQCMQRLFHAYSSDSWPLPETLTASV